MDMCRLVRRGLFMLDEMGMDMYLEVHDRCLCGYV